MIRKDIAVLIKKITSLDKQQQKLTKKLDGLVNEVCEFEAGVSNLDGDGILVVEIGSARTSLLSCLDGKTKRNKLTLEEFNKYGV